MTKLSSTAYRVRDSLLVFIYFTMDDYFQHPFTFTFSSRNNLTYFCCQQNGTYTLFRLNCILLNFSNTLYRRRLFDAMHVNCMVLILRTDNLAEMEIIHQQ